MHKKGDKYDPDNYRAIAVGSCIGKLFSSILLDRIIIFKRSHSPDPTNQLGFTKGAQTLDHIFTIKTIVDKCKKQKKKVFCTFVDLRKAFDSVCRPALLYKLSCLTGLKGKVFKVVADMYSNSTCQLKMDGKLSGKINVEKGTEQGHTLSPELFKTFMQDLSKLLDIGNCPTLQNIEISHLLWADDLVLIALDKDTLQRQMTILNDYCTKWGLQINFQKTNTVVFNDRSHSKTYYSQQPVKVGEHTIKMVEEYTYLGIVLHRNGSFTTAVEALRKKGLRAMYGMRKYISKNDLSFKALVNLFDFLIKPVLSYGSPIWTPFMPITTKILKLSHSINNDTISEIDQKSLVSLTKQFAQNPIERIHLKHLKWSNASHKKTSNIATWGDTGRVPLVLDHIKQSIKYMNRLETLENHQITKLAFLEQKELDLPWYNTTLKLCRLENEGDHSTDSYTPDRIFFY